MVKKKRAELVDGMMSSRIFTAIQYDQQVPMKNLEMKKVFNLKSTLGSNGEFVLKAKLNQDIFYPKEPLHMDVTIDNNKGKKSVEAMSARLIRRLEIADMKKGKVV